MITISLCMIVKNEEKNLPRCLDSIKDVVDEIIIVDTGSTDQTKEIAARYTHQIYDFKWIDNFAAARNFAFDQGNMQYCMWLDADDVLEEKEEFLHLKQSLTAQTDMVMMKYHTAFDEEGNPTFTYYRERIIRNQADYRWEGAIHEAIAPRGNIFHSEVAVAHRKTGSSDPDRNLRIFEKMISSGCKLTPREQFYYARELTYHGRNEEGAAILEQFLYEDRGWIENKIEACRNLAGCYERLNRPESAFQSLVRSFRYAAPRAETCCDLGRFFINRKEYANAVYWYESALRCPYNEEQGGFTKPNCYGYTPYIQLCVCWYYLGDTEKAVQYNEEAGRVRPQSQAYQFNRQFFESIRKKE